MGRRSIDGLYFATISEDIEIYFSLRIVSSLNQMTDQQHGLLMLLRDSTLRIFKYQVLEPS